MLCLVLCTCTACTSRSKEETETSETETDSAVSAYQNVLREIRQNHIFPGTGTEFAWEESLSIYYAIVDVNQDGIKELLLDFDYDSGPDGGITVYTYDPNAPTLVHEIGGFYTFPVFTTMELWKRIFPTEVLTVALIPPLVQPTPPLSGLIRYGPIRPMIASLHPNRFCDRLE